MLEGIDPPWHDEPEPRDGAVSITVWKNPIDQTDSKTYEGKAGRTLISWLRRNYPDGFGRPIKILWNGQPYEVEYSDRIMEPGDVIGLYVTPGEITTAMVVTAILTAIAGAAISIALNLIFGKPKTPGSPGKPDPVYSLSGAPNSARLGDPVPVIYGKVITVPDWASQPYSFYQDNDQYIDELLVIGQGRYQIDNVMVGDTPVSALGDPSQVSYRVFNSGEHAQTMGIIESATTVMENVITSPEVSNQELSGILSGGETAMIEVTATATAPSTFTITSLPHPSALPGSAFYINDVIDPGGFNPNGSRLWTVSSYNPTTGVITVIETAVVSDPRQVPQIFTFTTGASTIASGPFVVGKPGVRGNRIMLDIVFPNGLYKLANSGKLDPRTVNITIGIEPIDDNGAPAGAAISRDESITRATNTPQRMTFAYDVPVGRYKVRLTRLTGAAPDTQTVDNLVWTALKFRLINTIGQVYGDCTLMTVRIRATNGIGSEAASRVRVQCTRVLSPMGVGDLVTTRDPADAFFDVMTNPAYGARRPASEVDLAMLTSLKAHWAARAKFDGIFNSKGTIWEALGLILQPAGALPYPDGNLMSAVQDGAKALRTQFFSDANMVQNSLEIGYGFDKPGSYEGFSVEYRDPSTFAAKTEIYPAGAVDVEKATLFGCTDQATAQQYARLLWQRRLFQRKTARFTTELEGMIPRFTDRVAVASRLPRWGQTGVIAAVNGMMVRTDQPLDWTGTGHVMVLRSELGEPSGLIPVTRGGDDDEAILSADPGFDLMPGWVQEPTLYSFGTSSDVVRDFIITRINPTGGVATELEATIYAPEVYAGTMPWMVEPI